MKLKFYMIEYLDSEGACKKRITVEVFSKADAHAKARSLFQSVRKKAPAVTSYRVKQTVEQ